MAWQNKLLWFEIASLILGFGIMCMAFSVMAGLTKVAMGQNQTLSCPSGTYLTSDLKCNPVIGQAGQNQAATKIPVLSDLPAEINASGNTLNNGLKATLHKTDSILAGFFNGIDKMIGGNGTGK